MGYIEHLKKLGYTEAEHPMQTEVAEWWSWYTATNAWYSSVETSAATRRTYKVDRLSIKPARMVCQEWSSLIMNERTLVTTDDQTVTDWVAAWLTAMRFFARGQLLVERTMALGTGAWALRVDNVQVGKLFKRVQPSPLTKIVPQRFDARQVIPLTYDEDSCTECAFVSKTTIKGKRFTQVQMHLLNDDGTYRLDTMLFDKDGRLTEAPGILQSLETGSTVPLFALVSPGLDNTYADYSPFGVSIYDDAIGAVKLVDAAVDNMYRDIWLGQKMLFLDERMLETGDDGQVIVPRAKDQQLFRKTESGDMAGGGKLIDEYNPDLRIDDNRLAFRTGLEALGMRCGLGSDYFALEGVSGVKTATEVVAEDSDLFRTIRKHENALAPAIATIVAGAVSLARSLRGEELPECGEVSINFDDSVLEDTDAQRKRDLADIAAGLMQPWEYRMKWYGEDEAKARQMTETEGLPPEE